MSGHLATIVRRHVKISNLRGVAPFPVPFLATPRLGVRDNFQRPDLRKGIFAPLRPDDLGSSRRRLAGSRTENSIAVVMTTKYHRDYSGIRCPQRPTSVLRASLRFPSTVAAAFRPLLLDIALPMP